MAVKYLVPALAIAGRAIAQSSCSNAATTTVQSQGDASALASCSTFSGSIAVATGVSGNIALDGIQRITGNLAANNATQLTALSAGSLAQLDGTMDLEALTLLTSLSFPALATVGELNWDALPRLQGLSFSSTGVQMAKSVMIQNTGLESLTGINLQTVNTVFIVNNLVLNEISMQLGNVTNSLLIADNGMNVTASFPDMEWAYNMTIRNVSSIEIPSLASTNGSLGFYDNYFDSVNAPNLTTVGGDLTFVSNSGLTNLSMPQLTTIMSGFQVANNTGLDVVDLASLQTVGGALDFHGNFTNVEFPMLKQVSGAFTLTSANDISSNCTAFMNEAGMTKTIRGKISCVSNDTAEATKTSGGSSKTGSSTGASSTSSGAANTLVIGGATGLLGVVAAIFGML